MVSSNGLVRSSDLSLSAATRPSICTCAALAAGFSPAGIRAASWMTVCFPFASPMISTRDIRSGLLHSCPRHLPAIEDARSPKMASLNLRQGISLRKPLDVPRKASLAHKLLRFGPGIHSGEHGSNVVVDGDRRRGDGPSGSERQQEGQRLARERGRDQTADGEGQRDPAAANPVAEQPNIRTPKQVRPDEEKEANDRAHEIAERRWRIGRKVDAARRG